MLKVTLTEIWLRVKLVVLSWILLFFGGAIVAGIVSYLFDIPERHSHYTTWPIVFLMVTVPLWQLVMIVLAVVRLVGWARATPEHKALIRAHIREVLAAAPIASPQGYTRHILQDVKVAVAARDGGRCRVCGSTRDLQYDHIIPFSRGGSSFDPANVQLLCGYHNRLKSNR